MTGRSWPWWELNAVPLWGSEFTVQTHVVDAHDGDGLTPGQVVRLCPGCHALLHLPLGPTLDVLAAVWRPP